MDPMKMRVEDTFGFNFFAKEYNSMEDAYYI